MEKGSVQANEVSCSVTGLCLTVLCKHDSMPTSRFVPQCASAGALEPMCINSMLSFRLQGTRSYGRQMRVCVCRTFRIWLLRKRHSRSVKLRRQRKVASPRSRSLIHSNFKHLVVSAVRNILVCSSCQITLVVFFATPFTCQSRNSFLQ